MAEVETKLAQMAEALAEKESELVDLTARHNIAIRDTNEQVGKLEAEMSRMNEENLRLNQELVAARQGK
jgi:predicted nuclease with TOPRIM domain